MALVPAGVSFNRLLIAQRFGSEALKLKFNYPSFGTDEDDSHHRNAEQSVNLFELILQQRQSLKTC